MIFFFQLSTSTKPMFHFSDNDTMSMYVCDNGSSPHILTHQPPFAFFPPFIFGKISQRVLVGRLALNWSSIPFALINHGQPLGLSKPWVCLASQTKGTKANPAAEFTISLVKHPLRARGQQHNPRPLNTHQQNRKFSLYFPKTSYVHKFLFYPTQSIQP